LKFPIEGFVIVANQYRGRGIPRKGLGNLLAQPFSRWMARHRNVHDLPARKPQSHQRIEAPKADR
jgi:hypothetical protein